MTRMALLHVNFFSDVLGLSMNMDVLLPQQTGRGQAGGGRGRERREAQDHVPSPWHERRSYHLAEKDFH